jgi:hypothetical protein
MGRNDEDKDFTREHEAALGKIARNRAKIEETFEAQEEAIRKVTAKTLKKNKSRIAQELANKHNGTDRPDRDLIDLLTGSNDGFNNADYEPDPTGFEDRYWDEE